MVVWNHFIYSVCVGHVLETGVFFFEKFWKMWKILGNTGPFPTFQKTLKNVGFLKNFEK